MITTIQTMRVAYSFVRVESLAVRLDAVKVNP